MKQEWMEVDINLAMSPAMMPGVNESVKRNSSIVESRQISTNLLRFRTQLYSDILCLRLAFVG